MSRTNDGLPMLPPWLSENEVTPAGYEEPVRNLPQEDPIPEEKSSRGFFGRRKSRKDAPAPEPEHTPEPVRIPPTPSWNQPGQPPSPTDGRAPESQPYRPPVAPTQPPATPAAPTQRWSSATQPPAQPATPPQQRPPADPPTPPQQRGPADLPTPPQQRGPADLPTPPQQRGPADLPTPPQQRGPADPPTPSQLRGAANPPAPPHIPAPFTGADPVPPRPPVAPSDPTVHTRIPPMPPLGDPGLPPAPAANRNGDSRIPPQRDPAGDRGLPPHPDLANDHGLPPRPDLAGDHGLPSRPGHAAEGGLPPQPATGPGRQLPPQPDLNGDRRLPPSPPHIDNGQSIPEPPAASAPSAMTTRMPLPPSPNAAPPPPAPLDPNAEAQQPQSSAPHPARVPLPPPPPAADAPTPGTAGPADLTTRVPVTPPARPEIPAPPNPAGNPGATGPTPATAAPTTRFPDSPAPEAVSPTDRDHTPEDRPGAANPATDSRSAAGALTGPRPEATTAQGNSNSPDGTAAADSTTAAPRPHVGAVTPPLNRPAVGSDATGAAADSGTSDYAVPAATTGSQSSSGIPRSDSAVSDPIDAARTRNSSDLDTTAGDADPASAAAQSGPSSATADSRTVGAPNAAGTPSPIGLHPTDAAWAAASGPIRGTSDFDPVAAAAQAAAASGLIGTPSGDNAEAAETDAQAPASSDVSNAEGEPSTGQLPVTGGRHRAIDAPLTPSQGFQAAGGPQLDSWANQQGPSPYGPRGVEPGQPGVPGPAAPQPDPSNQWAAPAPHTPAAANMVPPAQPLGPGNMAPAAQPLGPGNMAPGPVGMAPPAYPSGAPGSVPPGVGDPNSPVGPGPGPGARTGQNPFAPPVGSESNPVPGNVGGAQPYGPASKPNPWQTNGSPGGPGTNGGHFAPGMNPQGTGSQPLVPHSNSPMPQGSTTQSGSNPLVPPVGYGPNAPTAPDGVPSHGPASQQSPWQQNGPVGSPSQWNGGGIPTGPGQQAGTAAPTNAPQGGSPHEAGQSADARPDHEASGQRPSELPGQPGGNAPLGAAGQPGSDPATEGQPGAAPHAGADAIGQQANWAQGGQPAQHGAVDPQLAAWAAQQQAARQGADGQQWGQPQGSGGQQWGGQPQWGGGAPGSPAPSLDDVPMRRAKKAPGTGWRKAVHHMSGGNINPGMSAEERRLQELVARIRQPVRGDYRIAVLSLKGGVGKTTTTMGLGSTFASIRGDRVIAVDANPDFGTLSQRVPLQTRSTVRDLLLDPNIQRYSDVRRHTSQGGSRLEVLASERDPAASEAFSDEEYRAVARILQRFYNIILTDCGTGLMHSAMAGVLDLAHSLVLISSSAIDGARSAAATLDWLSLHGHDHLVRNAVVVINLPRPGAPNVGINQLRDYFLSRCRAVHIIPYDPHLGEGAEIDLHRLSKPVKRAYVELAATVADDFVVDHRRHRG
ncbi:MinD/ParA family ATP-binding protein [Nocardia yamanashiensis]|uniref:MinD/ParA family ATP-binding protein n=1 Tax=Nocardia yamanashiensis TaxID=209247 RepID=UPI00350E34A0